MALATALLDLLTYDLPLDEVSSSVWNPLCSTDRRSLRGCSSLGRQLADSLITSATVQVTELEVDAAGVRHGPRTALWHQALSNRCNFLARLQQLTALTIDADGSADLLEILLRTGAATAGRITALSLHARDLSMSSTAIDLACPHLHELRFGRDKGRASADIYFLPRLGLRKLEVLSSAALHADALRSISNLDCLEHLVVSVRWGVPDGVLQDWTRLTRLTHCELWTADEDTSPQLCTLVDVAPLLRLTQLRHLALQSVMYGAAPDAAAPPSPAAASIAEALFLLRGLVHLETLHLGRCFQVDAPALAALDHLTRLTALGLGLMRCGPVGQVGQLVGQGGLAEGQGGHLLHLVRLTVSLELLPSQLLATLGPLLPLPSLVHLHTTAFDAPTPGCSLLSLNFAVSNDPDPGARTEHVVAEGAALRQVAEHLAAAPHLRLNEVHVRTGAMYVPSQATLSLQQVVEGLQPLAGGVTSLKLSGYFAVPDRNVWQPLCASLSGLQHLHLSGWILRDGEAAFLVVNLPALQRLTITESWGLSEAGWVGLAAAASRALVLSVDERSTMAPGPMVKARCRAEGERVHGMCYLTFEDILEEWDSSSD